MAPFDLAELLGQPTSWLVFAAIGFAFGFILESAGFGDARKLAAQFYWRDLTVLKVMFTAILVAMVLIFWSTALGWLDFEDVWVNPTFLWPGIVGGLIMGVGFVIGGFCPGTSLVGAATLKLDAVWFVAGTATGILIFGESHELLGDFWYAGSMGRYTLADWLDLPIGWIILGLVIIGVTMLWLGELVRRSIFGDIDEP